ncbi:MAG: amidohydrolase [Burkholderiales bacterium]|jgi:amidohydrolase
MTRFPLLVVAALAIAAPAHADLNSDADAGARKIEQKVIDWRRDIHSHPELGNREFRTSALVAKHLRALGMEVKTGVAHTGVVGILRGAKSEPTVALRADMDALPVTEQVDLPFASKVTTTWAGKKTGVMHACGHDTHVAMLMGVAEILAGMRDRLKGTVVFIFQPAEEGPPPGEDGGAAMMVKEGVMSDPKVDAVFGLHIGSSMEVGKLGYRPGPTLAAADILRITVTGKQTHGAAPWAGVDPVVVSAQIILGLQTIVSRQVKITREPAVVSIGSINGGNRFNIIPDQVEMVGTIRTLDEDMRADIHERVRRTAINIAQAAGATAQVDIQSPYSVMVNDPALTERMLPTLRRVVGKDNVILRDKSTGYEDFADFAKQAPGLFVFLGGSTPGTDLSKVAYNHSPLFRIDESALIIGVRTLTNLTLDYLDMNPR